MDAPLPAASHDPKKKSRASSCTTCRQAKLKCNLRESYPKPCSRCVANGCECRTDASFRRIPARSRVKDLELQLERLKRERTVTQAASTATLAHVDTPEVEAQSSGASSDSGAFAAYEGLPHTSPTLGVPPMQISWLNVAENVLCCPGFTVEGYTLSYADALELFEHFENRYYSHFCIMEPITSLQQLHSDSPFLFWAILSVASRNHKKHKSIFEVIQLGVDRIQAAVLATAIRSLLDLQGLLLMCAYPYYTSCDMQPDHSWTLLGSAISAAKQLGLDKSKDELSFEGHNFQDAVTKHARQTRLLTWIKCFELDVQLSCWHGHSPTMASPYIIRTIATFCNSLPSTQYTAMISVDIELARSLAMLEDGLHLQDPSLAGVVDTSLADIDAVKKRWQSAWNVDAELEFLTAKLYLYGIRLAGLLTETGVDDALYVDTLQASLHGAVKMATLTTDLNSEALFNAQSCGFHKNQHPLPGHGKHRVRSTFFAGVILLKYLDDTHQGSDDDKELARNAFGKIFQMFSTSTSTNMAEIENAARILETAGRTLGQGGGHLQPRVTTRMGASLVDNVVWLSSQVQSLGLADVQNGKGSYSSPEQDVGHDAISQPANQRQQARNLPHVTSFSPIDGPGSFW